MAAAALTPDAQEGIAAFLEKRPPDFSVDAAPGLAQVCLGGVGTPR